MLWRAFSGYGSKLVFGERGRGKHKSITDHLEVVRLPAAVSSRPVKGVTCRNSCVEVEQSL